MKNQLKILSTLILFFSINVALASATDIESIDPQEQQQPKQQGGLNDQNGRLEDQKTEEKVEYNSEDETEKSGVDSVEDDSVSKYNFIFYFLYKFKYEEEA